MVPKEQSVAPGTAAKFSVKATGDGVIFQWKKNGEILGDGRKYRGTNTHTLHIKDVEKSDTGSYQCLVKNDVNEVQLSEDADLAVSKLVVNVIDNLII